MVLYQKQFQTCRTAPFNYWDSAIYPEIGAASWPPWSDWFAENEINGTNRLDPIKW